MSQANFTPISLYYSTTASAVPTAANLVPGELAINTADGKLYYEDSSGVVQVLATKSTGSIGGSNTQVQFNNSGSLGGSSGLTWDGSFLTTSSIKNSALTSGRVTYAGASGLLTDSANLLYSGTDLTVYGLTVGRGPGASIENTTVGSAAFSSNSSGTQNVAVGRLAMQQSTSSSFSVAVGNAALQTLSTGSNNTAVGASALNATLTASNNTAVGYQAGYTNSTGDRNTFLGVLSGNLQTNSFNTFVGARSGISSTGTRNTFVGAVGVEPSVANYGCGELMTTGSNNTILGGYSGNFGGLDIRTASNYIVLADGEGNPLISTNSTRSVALNGAVPQTGTGITFPATQSASSNANTLDDYEEGTWTPLQGTFDTWTSPTFSATYTKIGRLVTVFLSQQSGTVGWSASDYMGGLPFTVGTSLQAIGYAGDTTPVSDNGYILADSNSTLLFFNTANASEAALCFTISYQV